VSAYPPGTRRLSNRYTELIAHIAAHANASGSLRIMLNWEAAQPTYYNFGRTTPPFLTVRRIHIQSTSGIMFNPPIGLNSLREVKSIVIAIKQDPGLLIPVGQLLQWALPDRNTHEKVFL
jgi:hypothetical protein